MPYKDPERRKAARKRRDAVPERKALLQEREKLRNKADRAAYKRQLRRDGRLTHEKAIDATRPQRARRNHEMLAGRPTPDFCECCGRPPTKRGLHFDHCHQLGHFRGWLCNGCNLALGYVDDDPNILRKLIAYLERTKDGTGTQSVLPGI